LAVALEGWLIADKFYRRKPERSGAAGRGTARRLQTARSNKYYVDEIYGAFVVKPLFGSQSTCWAGSSTSAMLGGLAWLLGGIATFAGAILQRWQSGNLRSYAAWLAAERGASCCLCSFPGLRSGRLLDLIWKVAGH
jgi:NADH-quinone oxidoreductase subunit L